MSSSQTSIEMAWPKGKKRGYRPASAERQAEPRHAGLREMIRGALEEVGGQQYLLNQARRIRMRFSRCLPACADAGSGRREPDKPVEIRVITGFDSAHDGSCRRQRGFHPHQSQRHRLELSSAVNTDR
jgi:hypothetical protein